MAARIRGLAIALILLMVYYGFMFDIAMLVKDSIVSWLSTAGFSSIQITLREYNATSNTWEPRPYQLDITGILDLALTLAIALAPLLVVAWYLWP